MGRGEKTDIKEDTGSLSKKKKKKKGIEDGGAVFIYSFNTGNQTSTTSVLFVVHQPQPQTQSSFHFSEK